MRGREEGGCGLQTCLHAHVPHVEPTWPSVFRHAVFAPVQSQVVKAADERGALARAAQELCRSILL